MRIKKKYQGAIVGNKIVNTKSDSQNDAYSCDYINDTVPTLLDFINAVYPIGSIYMSWVGTDPSTLFPGTTWEQLSGRYLYAAAGNSASQSTTTGTSTAAASGDTGAASGNTGAASGNTGSTTLTAAQSGLPSHNHSLVFHWTDGHYGGSQTEVRARDTTSNWTTTYEAGGSSATSGHTHTLNSHTHTLNNHTHSLNSHTHDMSYLAIFVWKRIS